MLALSVAVVVLGLKVASSPLGAAVQVPFSMQGDVPEALDISRPKKLHGRFLHITDIHPDGHYKAHAAESKACHRKNPKKKSKNVSGYYGTSYSECDSSFRLSNFTLDYLAENWASEIDFVVWTGDSARHDNDHQLPRTPDEIFDLNRAVTAKMESVFTHRGIPVVPSLGNNDIWRKCSSLASFLTIWDLRISFAAALAPFPVCSTQPGPNRVTTEFTSIWKSFIPFNYRQVFHRGAYYASEVVPNQLAIISLNTLYFYDSNKAVNGCPYNDPDDPGNLELDWLEVRLQEYLERDMQVWITGHVPPSPGNYFPECHMNVDHFFFLESIDLEIIPESKKAVRTAGNDLALYNVLLEEFAALPTNKKINLDEYAAVNVAPSVVPNYLPSFRIFSYNVTDTLDAIEPEGGKKKKKPTPKKPPKRKHGHRRGERGDKDKHCTEEKYQNSWKCHLDEPWNSDENSPSRTNRFWSPLGYAQYIMPNLDEANKTHPPVFELEYVTFPVEMLQAEAERENFLIPARHLPGELLAENTTKSKFAPYSLPDLTIPSWVRLAKRIADEKRVKLRKRFKKYMFSGGY
ncbi:endopolyphosphatase [Ephemerocybe angulata]|uniref:Endopolyphosphatase n=1 Tax=Ephemerocybe angulata TaxID=980116 RepID=A0A8H6IAU0_9AGAR|nr:endopolyphosphatase [Tulosesus angulatus]